LLRIYKKFKSKINKEININSYIITIGVLYRFFYVARKGDQLWKSGKVRWTVGGEVGAIAVFPALRGAHRGLSVGAVIGECSVLRTFLQSSINKGGRPSGKSSNVLTAGPSGSGSPKGLRLRTLRCLWAQASRSKVRPIGCAVLR